MPIAAPIRAIVFDYGNTLIEFAARQIATCDKALADCLAEMFGPVDFDALHRIRNRDRRQPYGGEFRENSLAEISTNLVRDLYGRAPRPKELQRILRRRYESFVGAVEVEDHVAPLLDALGEKYRLGLLSNYPDGPAIRDSLNKIGIRGFFDAVLVSGDVGYVKPHPLPFTTILERLDAKPHEALLVGDNWLGDIQGAKRVGMKAAWICQYDTPEKFDRQPGDHEPDLTLSHLAELPNHLPNGQSGHG